MELFDDAFYEDQAISADRNRVAANLAKIVASLEEVVADLKLYDTDVLNMDFSAFVIYFAHVAAEFGFIKQNDVSLPSNLLGGRAGSDHDGSSFADHSPGP